MMQFVYITNTVMIRHVYIAHLEEGQVNVTNLLQMIIMKGATPHLINITTKRTLPAPGETIALPPQAT